MENVERSNKPSTQVKAPARAVGHAGLMDRRHLTTGDGRLSPSDLRLWVVLAMALVFLTLGGLFLAAPALGALIYGVPEPEGAGRTYLRAIGARDAALAIHLAGLACSRPGAPWRSCWRAASSSRPATSPSSCPPARRPGGRWRFRDERRFVANAAHDLESLAIAARSSIL